MDVKIVCLLRLWQNSNANKKQRKYVNEQKRKGRKRNEKINSIINERMKTAGMEYDDEDRKKKGNMLTNEKKMKKKKWEDK